MKMLTSTCTNFDETSGIHVLIIHLLSVYILLGILSTLLKALNFHSNVNKAVVDIMILYYSALLDCISFNSVFCMLIISISFLVFQSDMERLFDVHIEKTFQNDSNRQEVCQELKKSMQGMRKSKSAINFTTYH